MIGALLGKFLLFGYLGWVIEQMSSDTPRYSAVFGGAKIPILPVFGVGGIFVGFLAPKLVGAPFLLRGAAYAGALSGLEFTACQIDRGLGRRSWAYGPDGSCVDLKHAGAWGVLGLGIEAFLL